jgi:hypothetical protein
MLNDAPILAIPPMDRKDKADMRDSLVTIT